MKIALLGADEESLLLATAALNLGHSIVWSGDVASAQRDYRLPWLQQPDQQQRWEALLDNDLCDAVVMGRGEAPLELRQEQLNQLVKNGIALVTTFPLLPSVLSYYEIDMGRNESGSLLRHFNPLVEPQEIVAECRRWVEVGRENGGQIEQVRWERPLVDRSREHVLWHFARDVSLLESVAGRLDRLGAHGASSDSPTYAALSVQLTGKSQLPVQWMVRPGAAVDVARLVLVADHGEIAVEFDDASRPVQLVTRFDGNQEQQPLESTDPSESAIRRLESAVREGGASSNWNTALHCMELADTIEISLRRGRMIEVHQQELTEDLAFKGTMSAAGCAILMILPPLLLLLGWLAQLAGVPLDKSRLWAYVLLALLSLFLLIQFLPKLLGTSSASENSREPE